MYWYMRPAGGASRRLALLALLAVAQLALALAASLAGGSVEEPYRWRYRPLQAATRIEDGVHACSIGYPAFFEWCDPYTGYCLVFYGIVTAGHCFDVGAYIYQNATGPGNRIGEVYVEEDPFEGSNVDAAFVLVEGYEYNRRVEPRPQPQTVSNRLHETGVYRLIIDYADSEADIRRLYEGNVMVAKGGFATGWEAGRVKPCGWGDDVVCIGRFREVNTGQEIEVVYFLTSARSMPGDSGGPIYHSRASGVEVLGITMGVTYRYGEKLTVAVPVYAITEALSAGGAPVAPWPP